jgi:hypothetical protein
MFKNSASVCFPHCLGVGEFTFKKDNFEGIAGKTVAKLPQRFIFAPDPAPYFLFL